MESPVVIITQAVVVPSVADSPALLDDLSTEEAGGQGGGLWLRSLCLHTLEYRGRSTCSTNILGEVWVGTLVDVVEFTVLGIVMGIVLF